MGSKSEGSENNRRIVAEAALEKSETIFRLLVDAVRDYAIFALDTEGRILTWNPGAERLQGYSPREIIGQHFSKFYTAEDIARDHPRNELKLASETGRYEEEGWRLRKDGSRFWANVVINKLVDEQGKFIGFAKITRDLTERKRAEEKLRQSEEALRVANEGLEVRVRERTEDLTKLTHRLEEAVRSRDEFLSIASHELKTPITSLKLHAQMRTRKFAKEGAAVPPIDKLIQMVRDDEKQINRLTRLVDDMLDITRLTSGKLILRPEKMDLCELTRDVLERFAPQFQEAGCEVRLDFCECAVGVWDPYRVEQILTNLLTNAMKYGHGQPIEVGVSTEGSRAVLSVRDRGIGIAPEDHDRVFRQFERAEAATHVSGLGLGLFIVRELVELHGGKIRLESNLGRGSRFIVELPLA